MSSKINIDRILNSNRDVFDEILSKLENSILINARKELSNNYDFNQELYEAIAFTLRELDEEEGFISKFLYRSFGIGKDKNPRREQLIILGGQLKLEINNLKREKYKINFHIKNIIALLANLERLLNMFVEKKPFLRNSIIQKRVQEYLREIYVKIDEVEQCKKDLNVKIIYLESCHSKYNKLIQQIPRHQEIAEDRLLTNLS